MLKLGVPVATPVKNTDILLSFKALFNPQEEINKIKNYLRLFLGAEEVYLFGSGREALYYSLFSLKKISKKNKVIIPAFICPSVPNAIRRAGLMPFLADINIPGFGINEEKLHYAMDESVLLVIQTHLFGYPQKIEDIKNIISKYHCFFMEDCAQNLGAKYDGKQSGSFGDFSLISFGMAKVLSLFGGGGFALFNKDLKRIFPPESQFQANIIEEALQFFIMLIKNNLIKFKYLGLIDKIWKRYIQRSGELGNIKVSHFSPIKANLLYKLIINFEKITKKRKETANYYYDNLKNLKGIILPEMDQKAEPVYLRFPILVEDIKLKSILKSKLLKADINISEMYDWENLNKVLSISEKKMNLENTEYASHRMLVLPTHHLLKKKDLDNIIEIFYETIK